MRRRTDVLITYVILAILGVCTGGCQQSSVLTSGTLKDPPQVGPESTAPLTGTASCSGRGCHADFERPDLKDQPAWRVSYTRWVLHDPHTRAYKVLYEDLAQEMGKKLGIADVAAEPRCLVCHCTPQAAAPDSWAHDERIFGVGCEACHGPARKWLVPHRDAAWQKMTPEQKRQEYKNVDMNFLQSQAVRAEVCGGCHIGAPAEPGSGLPARDMNHDFIAAGHPRLMFEYSAFLANEPKHWVEKDTRPDFDARAWAVGQAASAKVALRLLDDRATTKTEGRVWPELAEYSCYACHHDLVSPSWRQERGFPKDRVGALRPNQWYTGLLPAIGSVVHDDANLSLDALRTTLSRRSPDGAAVAAQAKEALGLIGQLPVELENRSYDHATIAGLRKKLVALVDSSKRTGWDEVEQFALGMRALDAADRALREKASEKPGQREEEISSNVHKLLKLLAFPKDADSPRNFRSPADEKELKAIFDKLK